MCVLIFVNFDVTHFKVKKKFKILKLKANISPASAFMKNMCFYDTCGRQCVQEARLGSLGCKTFQKCLETSKHIQKMIKIKLFFNGKIYIHNKFNFCVKHFLHCEHNSRFLKIKMYHNIISVNVVTKYCSLSLLIPNEKLCCYESCNMTSILQKRMSIIWKSTLAYTNLQYYYIRLRNSKHTHSWNLEKNKKMQTLF